MRAWSFLILVTAFMTAACSGGPETAQLPEPTAAEVPAPAAPEASAESADTLETPFTAEQIRDEWIEGLTVTMRRTSAGEARLERWRVVAADATGVDIEFAAVGDDGAVLGEPVTARSSWDELRDHASFPAAAASREWATRDTALGTFEGWLYRVSGEQPATIDELFFAATLPGAPVQMTTYEDGEPVSGLEQVARTRPTTP